MLVRPGRLISSGREAGQIPSYRVVLHVPFDGSDGATSATDESPSAHTLTFNGTAQLDTAEKKFGTASLLMDGTSDWVAIGGTATDFDIEAGEPFTMHGWARLSGANNSGGESLLGRWNTTGDQRAWHVFVSQSTTTPRLSFQWSTNGTSAGATQLNGASGAVPTDTFFHWAVTRDHAGSIRLFVDGVLTASGAYAGAFFNASTAAAAIGSQNAASGGASTFSGHIDQVEMIKGWARWTSNFTPPSAP